MNKNLIEEIKSEIAVCNREMEKAKINIAAAEARRICYDDRKTMLTGLLEIAERSESDD